jgi:hypothetical protein
MHCQSCDCELSDIESTRKDSHGKYLDLCSFCYYDVKNEVKLSNNFELNIIDSEIK